MALFHTKPWRCSVHEFYGEMACLFQVAIRHETQTADNQSLASSAFLWLGRFQTWNIYSWLAIWVISLMNTQPAPSWITRQIRITQSPRPFQSSISRGLFFFFHPSLRTLSSDINPPLSFHPHVQPIFPRWIITASSSLLTYIISPSRFQFMSLIIHIGKYNLGLKRIENSLTTYPKYFTILSPYLFCLPTMSLITPYRPSSLSCI